MIAATLLAMAASVALLSGAGPALGRTDRLQEVGAVVRELAQREREREARGIGAEVGSAKRAPQVRRTENSRLADDGGATGNTARTDDLR